MKKSSIKNNKKKNKAGTSTRKKNRMQRAGAGAGADSFDIKAETAKYDNIFSKAVTDVYRFKSQYNRIGSDETLALYNRWGPATYEVVKRNRDALLSKVPEKNATDILPICVGSFHGGNPNTANIKIVPSNIILCLRSYYGKLSYFDLFKTTDKNINKWTDIDIETRKEIFMKNIKLTTDIKYDSINKILYGKKYVNCNKFSSWYLPSQKYSDVELQLRPPEDYAQKKNFYILVTKKKREKVVSTLTNMFGTASEGTIEIGGKSLKVKKVVMDVNNIKYVFTPEDTRNIWLSDFLEWINSQFPTDTPIMVICDCCLRLERTSIDYSKQMYNFLTQLQNNALPEYPPQSGAAGAAKAANVTKSTQLCLNSSSLFLDLYSTKEDNPAKFEHLYIEKYFTQYNPLFSPFIIKFYNFIDDYLKEGRGKIPGDIIKLFLECLDGLTVGLFLLVLRTLDNMRKEDSKYVKDNVETLIKLIEYNARRGLFDILQTLSRGTHSFQYADFFRDHNKLADASSIYISKYILYLKLLKRLQLQPLTLVNPEISIVSTQSLIKYNELKALKATPIQVQVQALKLSYTEYNNFKTENESYDEILTNSSLRSIIITVDETDAPVNIELTGLTHKRIPVIEIVGTGEVNFGKGLKKLIIIVEGTTVDINITNINIDFTLSSIKAPLNKIVYKNCRNIVKTVTNTITGTYTAKFNPERDVVYVNDDVSSNLYLDKAPGSIDLHLLDCYIDFNVQINKISRNVRDLIVSKCVFKVEVDSVDGVMKKTSFNFIENNVFRYFKFTDNNTYTRPAPPAPPDKFDDYKIPKAYLLKMINYYKQVLINSSTKKTHILFDDLKKATPAVPPTGNIPQIKYIQPLYLDLDIDLDASSATEKNILCLNIRESNVKCLDFIVRGSGGISQDEIDFVNDICSRIDFDTNIYRYTPPPVGFN